MTVLQYGFATRAIHSGDLLDRPHNVPIHSSATFAWRELAELQRILAGEEQHPLYERLGGNPTLEAPEKIIASLEEGDAAILVASGMAAISVALFAALRAGDTAIFVSPVYGATHTTFMEDLPDCDIRGIAIHARAKDFGRQMNEQLHAYHPKVVFLETPTNPTLDIVDIQLIRTLIDHLPEHERPLLIVDNSFASPYNQRPLTLGANLVVHSVTKYLNGHGDLLAGAIVMGASTPEWYRERLRKKLVLRGPILDPHPASLIHRSLKTFDDRLAHHNANARMVARWLYNQPNVTEVLFPGLPTHHNHAVARRQMRTPKGKPGYGGMVSFRLAGGVDAFTAFFDTFGFEQPETFVRATASLGYVETILEPAALLSHRGVSAEERGVLGITNDLIRVSVGTENIEDILANLRLGLRNAKRALLNTT